MKYSCDKIARLFADCKHSDEVLSELNYRGLDQDVAQSLLDEWFDGLFNKMPGEEFAKTGGEVSNRVAFTARLEELYPEGMDTSPLEDKPSLDL